MSVDIRTHPGLRQVLRGTRRLISVLAWVFVSVWWLTCVSLLGLGWYYRWYLGDMAGNVFWPLAGNVGVIACCLHGIFGLWPLCSSPGFVMTPERKTHEGTDAADCPAALAPPDPR